MRSLALTSAALVAVFGAQVCGAQVFSSDASMASQPAANAEWSEVLGAVPGARVAETTTLDPVGHRLIVFGGWNGTAPLNETWSVSMTNPPVWERVDAGTPPPARYAHTAVYDPGGRRVVVFGGTTGATHFADVWALELNGSPHWVALSPSGSAPSARFGHEAALDASRDRIVVFGGYNGAYLADAWSLDLHGGTAWTPLSPAGPGPSARSFTTGVADPAHDRIVFFGGNMSGVPLGDTWSLQLSGPTSWVSLSPTGTPPSARLLHKSTYDPSRQAMVVFGGYDGSYRNDAWELSLGGAPAWSAIAAGGIAPAARADHSLAFDPERDQVLLFGGRNPPTYFNEAWTLSRGVSPIWTRVDEPPPPARMLHNASRDSDREEMLVVGGYASATHQFQNDTWALSLRGTPRWRPVDVVGPRPAPRSDHAVVLDPDERRLVLYGGRDSDTIYGDVWALQLEPTPQWSEMSPLGTPPVAREAPAAIYDAARDRMVMFGGFSGGVGRNDTWELSLGATPTWTPLPATGPSARWAHAAVLDDAGDRMIIFGGNTGSAFIGDVWALSLDGTPEWTALVPTNEGPRGRMGATVQYDPVHERLIVFGGYDGVSYLNDLWSLTLSPQPRWKQLNVSGDSPSGRDFAASAYDPVGGRMVLFGGNTAGTALGDTWALDLQPGGGNHVHGEPESAPSLAIHSLGPNPAVRSLWVDFTLTHTGPAHVDVFDATGRHWVRRELGVPAPGSHRTDVLRGEALPSGLYFLRLAQGAQSYTTRFAVLR